MKKRSTGKFIDETVNDIVFAHMVESPESGWRFSNEYEKKSYAARTQNKNKIDDSGISGELENIKKGVSPFEANGAAVSVKDAIELCQKAYWNVAIFKSTIDIQTEFANSKLTFTSANKTVENFFTAWDKKINGWLFRDNFYREWFRSGNVFVFRFDGELNYSEYRKITRSDAALQKVIKTVPLKYTILNPADIRCLGNASFLNAKYGKVLNDYEAKRLQLRQTKEDQELYDSLDAESKKSIDTGSRPMITLSPDKLRAIFCSKQDYEAMSVPMYYPVLQDINLKLEFKKAEQVIARTVDYAVLLITCGSNDYDDIQNNDIRNAITQLFTSESVGRVLISDFTTEANFIIPDLNKIFGPQKYEVVNQDIANGLMNIFFGEGKFANDLVKIQIFLERLNQAREAYINMFLKPEMQRIADELGFKDIPEVTFEEPNLRDDLELKKLYVHMAEIGALTVEESIRAMKTGILPIPDDSIRSQEEFRKLKDKKLYEPLLNQGKDPAEGSGREKGAKVPNQKKSVGPIGASTKFSMSKVRENIRLINNISLLVESAYRDSKNIKRLNKKHKDIAWHIAESIFINEPKDKWEESIAQYLISPAVSGSETNNVLDIAAEHSVSPLLGAILRYSEYDLIKDEQDNLSVNNRED